jgi:adenosylmethionine-8-amino-7-oxononanoate aminotransferase
MEQSPILLHPYQVPGRTPNLRVARGQGSLVYDDAGREYIDAAAGLWNLGLGLGNKGILKAMAEQGEALAYFGLFDATHGPAERLAALLVQLTESRMGHVYFSTTGTSAIEVALRTARTYQRAAGRPGKIRILSYDEGYHGCSWMNLSSSGSMHAEMNGWEDPLPDFRTIANPADEARSLAELRRAVEEEGDRLAALLIEPILGTGGIIVPSPGYFSELAAICREHDILIVSDEVATGCGRTGAMFASYQLGLEPDLIAVSKGLAAGYFPIGATLIRGAIVETMRSAGAPILFGSTQDGNPIGCAAALAALNQILSENLHVRAAEIGARIKEGLQPLVGSSVLGEIRGLGLMIGLDLTHTGAVPRPFSEQEAAQARALCADSGLLVYHYRSGLSLYPALTISEEEVDDMIDILTSVISLLA